MKNKPASAVMLKEMTSIAESSPSDAEPRIEELLNDHLDSFPMDEKIAFLQQMMKEMDGIEDSGADEDAGMADIARLFSSLLKENVSAEELSSLTVLKRLASSLSDLFTELNSLVQTINKELLGGNADEQTIRYILGSQISGDNQVLSPQEYIGQINKAFTIAHEAFKASAKQIVGLLLDELDPAELENHHSGISFDPRRKSKLFTLYQEKFLQCKAWYESPRFMNDLLREFENNYRKRSTKQV